MSVSAWLHHHQQLPRERGITDAMRVLGEQLEAEDLARLQAQFKPESSEPPINVMGGWLMDELLQAAEVEEPPLQKPLAN